MILLETQQAIATPPNQNSKARSHCGATMHGHLDAQRLEPRDRYKLKATIERHYKENEKDFDECLQEGRLDAFWKLWSGALENGYLEVLTGTNE